MFDGLIGEPDRYGMSWLDRWRYLTLDPGVVLQRDLLWYLPALVGLVAPLWWLRRPRVPPSLGASGRSLSPANAAWFLPVYLWGIASLLHRHWWLNASFRGIATPPGFLILHGTFSIALGGVILIACLLSEQLAKGSGFPTRRSSTAVPLPVCAALACVLGNWWLTVLLCLPLAPGQ